MPGLSDALAQLGTEGNEVGAWVFIKPNDDVIIRIARSEMGQGTLTGLAQLVAEELEGDWKKVKTEYPTPGQNLARNRVWGDMGTGGSRGIRTSHDYVRKGGAAARMMLLQAAADQWKVPVAELTVANSVITHAKSSRTTTYGKVAAAAAKLPAPDPKDIKLKDPKDWKIAGKGVKRLDTVDKLTGKQVYAIDVKLPGMLNASIMEAPVFGAKVKSYDEAKAKAMPGVRHVMKVGRHRRRRGRRHLVAGRQGAQGLEHRLGGRPQRQGLERDHHGLPQGGPGSQGRHFRRQQGRRRPAGDRRCRQEARGDLLRSLAEPRLHGADELHGQGDGGQVRGVGRHAGRRRRRWPPPRKRPACRSPSARSTRCTWAAASAGAAPSRTTSRKRCASPSRSRERR